MTDYIPVYDNGCFVNSPEQLENHLVTGGCNEDTRPVVFDCDGDICTEPIREGDTYLDVPQSDGTRKRYCEHCRDFMTHIAEVELQCDED